MMPSEKLSASMLPSSLTLYLVRHGKTVFNTVGRLQGWSDSPLTEEGVAVAAALGRALACRNEVFDAAFSSTSPRAADTAAIVLQQMGSTAPLHRFSELREYCFGGLEGEKVETVHRLIMQERAIATLEEWLAHYRGAPRNLIAESVSKIDPLGLAETEEAFHSRLQVGLNKLLAASPDGGKVLLVCHGMAITALLKMIDAACMPYQSVPNASLSVLKYQDGVWTIDQIGEVLS